MSTATTGFRLTATTGIHRGDRAYQQDQVEVLAHDRVPGCLLAVLADGMGGKSGGRKAAETTRPRRSSNSCSKPT
jgi:serine/threonine protein phosphatase PrpC